VLTEHECHGVVTLASQSQGTELSPALSLAKADTFAYLRNAKSPDESGLFSSRAA